MNSLQLLLQEIEQNDFQQQETEDYDTCCNEKMQQLECELKCLQCGLLKKNDVYQTSKKANMGSQPLSINIGGKQKIINGYYNKGTYKTKQKPSIVNDLKKRFQDEDDINNDDEHKRNKRIPQDILDSVASDFDKIIEIYKLKKVKKDEIAAYLLYLQLGKNGLLLLRHEISRKFGLKKKSFTCGESIVTEYFKEHQQKFEESKSTPIYDLSTRYSVDFGFDSPRHIDIMLRIAQQVQDDNIIITSAISTRACCCLCILIGIEKMDVQFKKVEQVTGCKKSTMAEAFQVVCKYIDRFEFLKLEYDYDEYVSGIEYARDVLLHVNKRQKKTK